MINWDKPIELTDGTPATVVSVYSDGDVLINIASKPYHSGCTEYVFRSNGRHAYGRDFVIRNKEIKMIDKKKPVQCGNQDAKIVHTFDNGNMVVVVDGSTQVHNFTPDGTPVDGRGLILTNKVERIERWLAFNTTTHTSGIYPILETAIRYKGSNPNVGITKIILENGVIVQTEIINV